MSGVGSSTKCWPEPPAITVTNVTVQLGEDEGRWVRERYSPPAATGFLTLTYTPVASSLILVKNGLELDVGVAADATLAAKTITLGVASVANDKYWVVYFTTEAP